MRVLDLLQSQMLSSEPNWTFVRQAVYADHSSADARERVLASIVGRLCSTLQNQYWVDTVPLLRQILRITGGLRISTKLWKELRPHAEASGIIGLVEIDHVELSARPWQSTWLEHSQKIDYFERRSSTPPALGDGILNAMHPSWTNYRSEAQKAAVDAWLFAPPGSTTLVTLPTGGGKSLCTIMPAWFELRGGRVNSGTTIVVVPTVALALDQQKQARTFFKGSVPPESRTGANTLYERRDIEASLRDGRLPILYTSPEFSAWLSSA